MVFRLPVFFFRLLSLSVPTLKIFMPPPRRTHAFLLRCVFPNGRYNACITALARCGRWRQALAILDHMRFTANAAEAAAAATAFKADPAAGIDGGAAMSPSAPAAVRPDVFSYSAAITACGNCGEWRRALALLRVMREQGVPPNVRDVGQSTLSAGATHLAGYELFCRASLSSAISPSVGYLLLGSGGVSHQNSEPMHYCGECY